MLSVLALLALLCHASVTSVIPADSGPLEGLTYRYAPDGYQYAAVGLRGNRHLWLKNARIIDEAAPGSFKPESGYSDDGLLVYFEQSREGFELHYDGKGTKAFYPFASSLTVGPKGHVAFLTAQGEQWTVMTPVGGSRPYASKPFLIAVGSTGRTVYRVDQKVYADHQPIGDYKDGDRISVSPDAMRLAVVGSGGAVRVDGKEYGPYANSWEVRFSPDGKHWALLAKTSKGQSLILHDGKEKPSRPFLSSEQLEFRPGDNEPHWQAAGGVETTAGLALKLPSRAYGDPFIAFSPSGKHSVVSTDTELIVDGQPRPHGLRRIVGNLVFDDENEFHALGYGAGNKMVLLCGAVRKVAPERSICVRRGSALYAGKDETD